MNANNNTEDIRKYLFEYYYNFNTYNLIRTRNYIGSKYNQIYEMIKCNNLKHKFVEQYTDMNIEICCGHGDFDLEVQLEFVKVIKQIIDENKF